MIYSHKVIWYQVFHLIQINCIYLYDFKYSYLMQIIYAQWYVLNYYFYSIINLCFQAFFSLKYSYLIQIILKLIYLTHKMDLFGGLFPIKTNIRAPLVWCKWENPILHKFCRREMTQKELICRKIKTTSQQHEKRTQQVQPQWVREFE